MLCPVPLTLKKEKELLAITFVMIVFLFFPTAQTHGGENVSWKIFKYKNDVFTIKYPSNWAFAKYQEDSSEPINIYFYYQGRSSLAELALYAEQSLFTNSSDLVSSYPVYLQNHPNYKVLQTTQCGKFFINNMTACDTIVTYKDTRLEDEPIVKHQIIGNIDENGVEYIIEYFVTEDLHDHYLPVAKEMIRSFNITGNPESSDSDSESTPNTEESPNLPPLTEPPTIGKI